jgi:hypothetical protein
MLPDAEPVLAMTMATAPDALPQSSLLSSVHDTRPPLPKEEIGAAFATFSTRHAMAWAWLLWLGLLLVASVGLDWVLKRRGRAPQAEGQPEAAGTAGVARHHPAMSRVAIVLGMLLVLNAILLLAVFVSR